jgi:hypothetical protein
MPVEVSVGMSVVIPAAPNEVFTTAAPSGRNT